MELIGTVLRLQVQTGRLKPGPAGARVYDPSPLREVDALEVGPRGCVGLGPDGRLLDVHHADHPDTRNVKLLNGLSVLPRAHYEQLRMRYGPRLVDGSAGESLLLDGPARTVEELEGDLVLEVDDGLLPLGDALVASPCVEFSRWVLGRHVGDTSDEVLAALDDLDHGRRGFYLRPQATGVVRRGARLLRV